MTNEIKLKQKAVEKAIKSGLKVDEAVKQVGWTRSAYYSSRYNSKRAKGKTRRYTRRPKIIDMPTLEAVDDLPSYYFAVISSKKGVLELARSFL